MEPQEAEEIYRTVYANKDSLVPIYDFLTYFDMIISTYEGEINVYGLPNLPLAYRKDLDVNLKVPFSKIAAEFNKPLKMYSILLSD